MGLLRSGESFRLHLCAEPICCMFCSFWFLSATLCGTYGFSVHLVRALACRSWPFEPLVPLSRFHSSLCIWSHTHTLMSCSSLSIHLWHQLICVCVFWYCCCTPERKSDCLHKQTCLCSIYWPLHANGWETVRLTASFFSVHRPPSWIVPIPILPVFCPFSVTIFSVRLVHFFAKQPKQSSRPLVG